MVPLQSQTTIGGAHNWWCRELKVEGTNGSSSPAACGGGSREQETSSQRFGWWVARVERGEERRGHAA